MSLPSLHSRLTEYGFSKEEAEVYVFLTAMGPTPARVIARRFSINRMRAYRVLKGLEERGFIHRIMGRPVRYVAAPAADVLGRSVEEAKQRLSALEADEKRVLEDLAKIRTREPEAAEEPRFRIYQGRQQVYELLSQMGGRVKREVNLVTTSLDLLRLSFWGLDDMLIRLSKEGKQIRMLVQVDESSVEEVERIMGDVEVRHISIPSPVRFAIVDDGEILTSVAMDDSMSMTTDDDTGLWTNAPSFISAIKIFYESLWSLAPEARAFIKAMRTGEKPQEFRALRNMEEYVSTLSSMIRGSERSVDVMVRRVQDLPVSFDELAELIEGKRVRVLTRVEYGRSSELSDLVRLTNLRHNADDTNLTLVIVDGRESLLATREWKAVRQAAWSNLDSYVAAMSLVFEDYWSKGKPAQQRFMELSTQQNVIEITETLKRAMEDDGWTVSLPGELVGSSGATYSFMLTASHRLSSRRLGLNLSVGDDAFNKVIEMSARKLDVGEASLILASVKPFDDEIQKLAALYGISLVQAYDLGDLAEKVVENLKTLV
jgi:sugar-specific transcriptional regulator TrmB